MLPCRLMRRTRRWFTPIFAILTFILAILTLFTRARTQNSALQNEIPPPVFDDRDSNPLIAEHASFWRTLHSLILNNHPQTLKKPELIVPRDIDIPFDPDHARSRPDLLWMDQLDVERMRNTHSNFVTDILKVPLTHGPAYIPGTQGIITTTPDSSLTLLTVSLHMLRRTGCTLPVEIFLTEPTHHSHSICTNVFSTLNTKCFYFSDIFTRASSSPISLSTYQYKIFSILFSSFEDILFLDSDAWPLTNPEPLFNSLPLTDVGLILWPDFWSVSESPYFFDIAKLKDIPSLSARPATEAGELMYSKSKHGHSLMLATYYNYFGPEYYYVLQSQGAPGQGDKETFGWAATVMDEEVYRVKRPVVSLGRHDEDGQWRGSGMVQFDPVQDFFTEAVAVGTAITVQRQRSTSKARGTHVRPKPLFVHVNYPKFDPGTIFDDDVNGVRSPIKLRNGMFVRAWFPLEESLAFFGFDLERRFWDAMKDTACGVIAEGEAKERKNLQERYGQDEVICAKVQEYIHEVFGP